MNRKLVLLAGVSILSTLMVAGSVYAWKARSSDVGRPVPTPSNNTVRYHVVGTSMDPTIKDGDWLLATTNVKTIHRDDIVIMRYPKDETKVYCRRVVAVAGDRVDMKYYSNVKLTTIYTPQDPQGTIFPQGVSPMGDAYGEYDSAVGAGELYVVGDNTVPGGSYDSDEWGLLPTSDVAGVVTRRLQPDARSF